MPLRHDPGEAQVDFGQALVKFQGLLTKVAFFVMALPHSDGFFVAAYPRETAYWGMPFPKSCSYFSVFSNQTGPPHLPVTTISRSPSPSRSATTRFTPEPMP